MNDNNLIKPALCAKYSYTAASLPADERDVELDVKLAIKTMSWEPAAPNLKAGSQ